MAKRTALLALLCALIAGCSKDERPAIEVAFDEYKAAILTGDGPKAVMRVTQSTIDYYSILKRAVLEAGPDQVRAMSFTDKVSIGMMRMQMDMSYLQQLSPEQLFMYAVQEKWVGEGSTIQASTIEEIKVDGVHADAAYIVNARKAPFRFRFAKEGGVWKNDLTAILEGANQMIQNQMPAGSGRMNDEQLVLTLLSARSGKKIGPEIWDRPKIK